MILTATDQSGDVPMATNNLSSDKDTLLNSVSHSDLASRNQAVSAIQGIYKGGVTPSQPAGAQTPPSNTTPIVELPSADVTPGAYAPPAATPSWITFAAWGMVAAAVVIAVKTFRKKK